MAQVIALDGLLAQRRVWKGHARPGTSVAPQPTGWQELDDALPTAGWPEAALSELLLPADGLGELRLLWPTLARLSQRKEAVIALVCPPYRPCPAAWQAAGIRLSALQLITASNPREALWATEQCLRSGACSAVLGWPRTADDRALRRLQVAAETGQALGFAFRPAKAAANPSPAALRVLLEAPGRLRVLKCRGGLAPPQAIQIPQLQHAAAQVRRHEQMPSPALPAHAPTPPRPSLHEVLRGGLRPIAVPPSVELRAHGMPAAVLPRAATPLRSFAPHTPHIAGVPGPRIPAATVPEATLPAIAPALSPAPQGTAPPVPAHGIASTTVQA